MQKLKSWVARRPHNQSHGASAAPHEGARSSASLPTGRGATQQKPHRIYLTTDSQPPLDTDYVACRRSWKDKLRGVIPYEKSRANEEDQKPKRSSLKKTVTDFERRDNNADSPNSPPMTAQSEPASPNSPQAPQRTVEFSKTCDVRLINEQSNIVGDLTQENTSDKVVEVDSSPAYSQGSLPNTSPQRPRSSTLISPANAPAPQIHEYNFTDTDFSAETALLHSAEGPYIPSSQYGLNTLTPQYGIDRQLLIEAVKQNLHSKTMTTAGMILPPPVIELPGAETPSPDSNSSQVAPEEISIAPKSLYGNNNETQYHHPSHYPVIHEVTLSVPMFSSHSPISPPHARRYNPAVDMPPSSISRSHDRRRRRSSGDRAKQRHRSYHVMGSREDLLRKSETRSEVHRLSASPQHHEPLHMRHSSSFSTVGRRMTWFTDPDDNRPTETLPYNIHKSMPYLPAEPSRFGHPAESAPGPSQSDGYDRRSGYGRSDYGHLSGVLPAYRSERNLGTAAAGEVYPLYLRQRSHSPSRTSDSRSGSQRSSRTSSRQDSFITSPPGSQAHSLRGSQSEQYSASRDSVFTTSQRSPLPSPISPSADGGKGFFNSSKHNYKFSIQ